MTTDARWAKAYLDKSEAVETLLAFIILENLTSNSIDWLKRIP
jgi:hypothetical protein